MQNKLIVIVSSLFVATRLFSCAEPLRCQDPASARSKNLFVLAFASLRTSQQYFDDIARFEKTCGICGEDNPVPTDEWAHPFGNLAHADCMSLIKRVEDDTVDRLRFKVDTRSSYSDIHRLVVWYVIKLCSPYSIAECKKKGRTEELTCFYSHAIHLAIARYADYLENFAKLTKKENVPQEAINSQAHFLAGLFTSEDL